ncbi:hypothetical protein [Motilibacter peucedani]|uniref:hypothetical protein n=1 Tax=Motilibacter peucedani TaxID=598650 RepID=UPI0011C3E14E|nr:hypothetical protein [Motilibacter peucedani]
MATSSEQQKDLDRLLSEARMGSYQTAAAGAPGAALSSLDVYVYNMRLAGALLGPLHLLEVVIRNAMHEQLTRHLGRPDWWESDAVTFEDWQDRSLEKAELDVDRVCRNGGRDPVPGDTVAALEFGFWVGLLGPGFERDLWRPALQQAFPNNRRGRDGLYKMLSRLRRLRNRVGHHEPVHDRVNLRQYEDIINAIKFVSVPVSVWVDDRSLVPVVLQQAPGTGLKVQHF